MVSSEARILNNFEADWSRDKNNYYLTQLHNFQKFHFKFHSPKYEPFAIEFYKNCGVLQLKSKQNNNE